MIDLITALFLALTDAQWDKVLHMTSESLHAIAQGVKALWDIMAPLLIGVVSLQIVYYQNRATKARAEIVGTVKAESAVAKADRTAIMDELTTNTTLTNEVKQDAQAAYKEANHINVKLESIGIQTKSELGSSAENPIHTVTP